MNQLKSLFIILLITHLSCTANQQTPVKRIDGSYVKKTDITAKIEHLTKEAKVTGLAISIFNSKEATYQKAFGYAHHETKDTLNLNHIFYGASFSKSLYGYIIAQLANEELIDLDQPIQEYLDIPIPEMEFRRKWRDFSNIKEDKRYEKITTRMCLSHTTGLPNWRWITREGAFDREGKIQFYSDPGSTYSYSGEGIRLHQKVLEAYLNEGLEDMAQERVFKPLNMNMTSYIWQDRFEDNYCHGHNTNQKVIEKDIPDEAGAAGSMETTILDYTLFLKNIMALKINNDPLTNLMFTPNISIKSKKQFGPEALIVTDDNDKIDLSYGLGWGILKSDYGHGYFKEGHGEGFQHYSIIFPDRDIGMIIMSNSDNAESIFKELLEFYIGDT